MLGAWLQGLAAAAPSRCAVCGRWPAQPVCDACAARFAPARPRCRRCAIPVAAGIAECGACLREPPPLDRCHAAVDYGYPWSGLVSDFKFHAQPGWAATLAALIRRTEGVAQELEGAQRLLPMPLSRQRLAGRGYNQALELARHLAPAKVDAGLLLRLRDTPVQTALGRREREANVRGAFGVEPLRQPEVRGLRLLLVDDVMTSGASLFAAAACLRAAGAAEVSAVVLARTDEPGE
jgi:ComF family protein